MEKIRFFFDKKSDILDISIGKPKKAVSEELGNDIIARKNPKTKKIIGFTVLNFTKRFEKVKKPEEIDLPLKASISAVKN